MERERKTVTTLGIILIYKIESKITSLIMLWNLFNILGKLGYFFYGVRTCKHRETPIYTRE